MDVGIGCVDVVEREWAEDDGQQHEQGDLLGRPKRGDVGGIQQALRGKIPGNPG